MKKHILLIVLLTLILSGCSSKSSVMDKTTGVKNSPEVDFVTGKPGIDQSHNPGENSSETKEIKTLYAEINSEDPQTAFRTLSEEIKKLEGSVMSQNESLGDEVLTIYLTIKIPSENFDAGVESVKKLGEVKNLNITSTDVTTEYIDYKARLDTLQIQEERLLSFLSKVTLVEDMLRLESELQRVRYEIESIQGQINYIERQDEYSTFNITINEEDKPTQSNSEGGFKDILFAFKDGYGVFIKSMIRTLAVIAWLLPAMISTAILTVIILKVRKYLNRK